MGSTGVSASPVTQADVKGAQLVLKTTINPKEIQRAQDIIRQYKEQEELRKNEEQALTRELGQLRSQYSFTDNSPENIARGERIKQIMKELELDKNRPQPRANRRNPIVKSR